MKKQQQIIPFLLAAVLLLSCNKTDVESEVQDPGSAKAPSFVHKQEIIKMPIALRESSDPYAELTKGYVMKINDLVHFGWFFVPPANAQILEDSDNQTYNYIWNEGGYSIIWKFVQSSSRYYWSVTLSGSYSGFNYSNFVYLNAEETIDATSGSMTLFDRPEAAPMTWTWNTDNLLNRKLTLTIQDEFYKVIQHENSSGSLLCSHDYDVNGQFQLVYDIQWDSIGNGSWEYHDRYSGSIETGGW